MIVQILLWVLFVVVVSIIPVMVFRYGEILKYKKEEVKDLLTKGDMSKKYLQAYYPEPAKSQKQGQEKHEKENLSDDKLKNKINEFFKNEYNLWNFLVPVIALICITGVGLFFFLSGKYNLVFFYEKEFTFLKSIPDVIYLGFLGALFSGIVVTYSRYHNMDLTPFSLYSINAKILICSTLGYLWLISFPLEVALFVSFGIGFTPLQDLIENILRTTFRKMGEKEPSIQTSPLCELQGLNKSIIHRLEETGILSCQSLAYSDPIKLLFKTNYELKIIVDWIDQALLYNYVGKMIEELRPIGIRGIVEFAILYESDNDNLLKSVAQRINANSDELKHFLFVVYDDPHICFIWDLIGDVVEQEGDK
ncbi:MAG: hypothetical protein WBD28_12235 [Candidatus Zixiibacteriota bacterium]